VRFTAGALFGPVFLVFPGFQRISTRDSVTLTVFEPFVVSRDLGSVRFTAGALFGPVFLVVPGFQRISTRDSVTLTVFEPKLMTDKKKSGQKQSLL
jgi:hypothetical protein